MLITTESVFSHNVSRNFTGNLPTNIALSQQPVTNADLAASGKRGSAVLMLFCSPLQKTDGACHLIFIRRSTTVKTHKGQISFPGGRCEPLDGSPEETAIRETTEEIGVNASNVVVLGQLPVVQAADESMIVPVVGILNTLTTKFVPDVSEVDYVFTAPWSDFRSHKSLPFIFNMFGNKRESHLYNAADQRIWGLTAGILHSANLE
jgi:8-oxo-dGTP pyrophosphatase MutT (NUDIX family)